jgi:polar amino acid transport system substrate-binding protein
VKRLLPLLAVAALVSVLAACGGGGGGNSNTTTTNAGPPLKTPGKVVIGFGLPAPSFWNGQASGSTLKNPSGFEYSLGLAIAKQLGVSPQNVTLLNVPFSTMLLAGHKPFDYALEETTITAARAKQIGFSIPYFSANQGVLIAKGVKKPTSVADLKKLQLCAQQTTTAVDLILHKIRPQKQLLQYSASSSAAFDAVESGACQALILDTPIIEAQAQKKPGAYGGVVGQINTHEGYGAVFQLHSPLIPDVNKAIRTLLANGTIGKLAKKWEGYDPNKVPILK